MIRWALTLTLFRKEIVETLRDQRTLLLAFGLPILLYPLLALSLTKIQESRAEAKEAKPSKVAVWGSLPSALRQELEKTNRFELLLGLGLSEPLARDLESHKVLPFPAENRSKPKVQVSSSKVPSNTVARASAEPVHPVLAEAERLVAARSADAVLLLWPGFESSLGIGGLSRSAILYDSVRDGSAQARSRLEEALKDFRTAELSRRELEHRLPAGFSKAVEIEQRDLAPAVRVAGKVIGSMLPLLLIIMSASGGLYAAIDLTAGEKERNTLQTLLCAPLTSLEIITGKFLAAWVIVLLTTVANVASMAATFTRLLASVGGIEAPLSAYFIAFLVMLPATFMVTAIFLAVAVFARDFKDGQNLLTPMFLLLMLPLAITALPDIELDAWTSFVPLANICLLIKGVFLHEAKGELVFLTLASSVIYAGLALAFAAKVFQQEQILLGGSSSWKSLIQWRPVRRSVPTPGISLLAFALTFVILFYASLLLTGGNMVVQILAVQLGFFLLPNLGMAWRWGFSRVETYRLVAPSWQAVLGAILIGFTAWGVTAGIVMRVFPPPEGFTKSLEKVLLFEGQDVPLVVVWIIIGLTPAICEELFFRGLIMSGFRKMGLWPALLASSFLFAIAHSSIYRLLPTFILGMIIGYSTWRSGSMFTGIIIHAINNSLLATLLHKPEWIQQMGFSENTAVPWWLGGVMLVLTGIGIKLVNGPVREGVGVR